MNSKYLFASDIDGTLIPHNEDNQKKLRTAFSKRIEDTSNQVDLCYASGRSLLLINEAISTYSLPKPTFLITDVGTGLYEISDQNYLPINKYQETLANMIEMDSLQLLHSNLSSIPALKRQKEENQSTFKLSYDTAENLLEQTLEQIKQTLSPHLTKIQIISSRDPKKNCALIDIIPAIANKFNALNFLIDSKSYAHAKVVYAGDSGNDLAVFKSGIQSIVVQNTDQNTKDAINAHPQSNQTNCYFAKTTVIEGVLEGWEHYKLPL